MVVKLEVPDKLSKAIILKGYLTEWRIELMQRWLNVVIKWGRIISVFLTMSNLVDSTLFRPIQPSVRIDGIFF